MFLEEKKPLKQPRRRLLAQPSQRVSTPPTDGGQQSQESEEGPRPDGIYRRSPYCRKLLFTRCLEAVDDELFNRSSYLIVDELPNWKVCQGECS